MKQRRAFSNEELTAYLDGEADAELADSITAALDVDRELREQLRQLDIDTSVLRESFDSMLAATPAAPQWIDQGSDPGARPSADYPTARLAAVGIFCLISGWLAALFLNGPPSPSWQDFAAKYHALYVTETLNTADTRPAIVARGLGRVADALGRKIDPSVVQSVDGLTYKRAQILGFQGAPLIQVAYLSATGEPVALCIIKAKDAADEAVRTSKMEGMASATWTRSGYSYLLIGGHDDALIKGAASKLFSTM